LGFFLTLGEVSLTLSSVCSVFFITTTATSNERNSTGHVCLKRKGIKRRKLKGMKD
jgi:hypothetical protein